MTVKGPIGRCRYCGQEFMTKPGLKRHEMELCSDRSPKRATFEPVHAVGGSTVWKRKGDERF